MTITRRNLTEKHKKEIAKRAVELKKKYPYLTWTIIVERLNGVTTVAHLHSLIKKYTNYFKKNR